MTPFFKTALLAALAAASVSAQGAGKHDYTYTPVAGVHEVQYFHGCYDHTDGEKRPKVDVLMSGLATTDVLIETKVREEGKPSTEMITFRLKNMDASLSVQFRSHDGPHCQQGVQRIAFKNATLHSIADLNAYR
ncbi:hypothetical protein [Massilia sp. TSP1-1-2]|uniref:hypothetical protein n=1 Tax=unclassified Massilia TaxID=2609279 RepID=UPI003CE80287